MPLIVWALLVVSAAVATALGMRELGILWTILLGGGIVVVAGATVASLQYGRPAGLFLGALTAIIALVLVVIYALDQPFRYGLAAETHEYVLLAEMIRTRIL